MKKKILAVLLTLLMLLGALAVTTAADGGNVAEVNGTQYATLQEAVDAASTGETVTLLADTSEDVTIDKSITLNLGGNTLTNKSAGKATISVTGGTVMVKNGTVQGGTSYYNIEVKKDSNADLTLEGVTATAGNTGSSMIDNWGTMTITSGAYSGGMNTVKSEEGSTLTINGGTFTCDYGKKWSYTAVILVYGDTTINGGTFIQKATNTSSYAKVVMTGIVDGYEAITRVTGGTFTNEKLSGIFHGYTPATSDNFEVSGGTFNKYVSDSYFKTGYIPVKNADGTYGVKEGKFVAEVGSTGYETFDEAIAAANASTKSKTIYLRENLTVDHQIVIENVKKKTITLNLNGFTLTSTYAMGASGGAARYALVNNTPLTVKNGTFAAGDARAIGAYAALILEGATVKQELEGGHAVVAFCANDTKYTVRKNSTILGAYSVSIFANNATVEISDSKLNGTGNTLYHNGSNYGLKLTVTNTTITSSGSCGVYISGSTSAQSNEANRNGVGGYQQASFTNCTIEGATNGVEVKYTNLTLDGCTVSTTAGEASYKQENNGPAGSGFAVVSTDNAMNSATPKPEGTITITGSGKYTGPVGLGSLESVKTEFKDFTDDTIKISGGTFDREVPEEYCADGYMPTTNADGTYGVKEGKYVAEYNGTKYDSLQAAVDAASQKNGGQTEVTLLCDVTITETVSFAKQYSAGSVLLNLGGYTLTGEGCRALQINKGNLYLENGTVTSTGIINSSSVIRIGSNEADYSGISPMLYMRNGAKVLAPESYGVTIFGSATVSEQLTVAGNASIEATGPSPAISGNGGQNYHVDGKGTKILITGNAVVSAANNYAIYHPDNGTLDIQGGTITGKGGIQMCSGTLKISGSSRIEALGKADHETGSAGPIYDVAAISVANRSYPGGAPVVTIKGTPTVTAADGEVIHAYTWSSNAESEWAEAGDNINVSGGTYSKTFNEAYLAADCTLVAGENGTYTVEQKPVAEYNGTKYTSLSQALLDARNAGGGTVKLLENVTQTTYSLDIGTIKLDLNKKTLTLDGGAQLYTSGSATINNGTIKRIDTPTSGSSDSFAIQVMSGSSLILGASSGKKVTLESTYGIYNVGGTLNVRYATITTEGWSIAVNDSATKTGEVIIGLNATTTITSRSGNCIGTAVGSKPNVTIHKGTLTSKGTDWDAGVIYWASEGTLTINGGTLTASSAEGSEAAAVYQKNGTVKISGSTTRLLGSKALVVKAGEGSTGTMVTELSGGKYSTKPDEAWVVEGKEIHETDSLYVVEGPYVVEVTHADGTTTSYDAWSKLASVWNESGATIKLIKDIETAELVATNGKLTIDFNGHTLAVTKDEKNSNYAASIIVHKSGELTLKDSVGNGGMTATNVYGVEVMDGTLTIESGNYNGYTSVVQVDKGTAYIKGGTFQTEDADKSYILNCIDEAFKAGTAKMEVTGGTFHGFDPSANPEGEGTTYVANGYVVTESLDGVYTVEEYLPVEVWTGYSLGTGNSKVAGYATIEEAAANLGDYKWILIAKDYTLSENFTIPTDVRVDVKGGATLTVAEGATLTVAADAKRLAVLTGGSIVNNGTIMVCGTSYSTGKVMIDGTLTGKLSVPEGYFLDNNGNNYFATENSKALYEVTYSDGSIVKSSGMPSLDGATKLTLLRDVVDYAGSISGKVADGFIFDLGGYTLTGKATATTGSVLNISAPVTIQNGTIKFTGEKSDKIGALQINGADVTIAENVTIDGGKSYAIWPEGYGHTLTVNGTVTSNGDYAIAGFGDVSGGYIDDCSITVNAGAVISAPNGVAIYHPELGTVTINGGKITGHTGIEMCAGKLVVKDGTITSTGADDSNSDNVVLNGAAISILDRSYPGGSPSAEITGGTFTSATAPAIRAYHWEYPNATDWTDAGTKVNISGGTFSSIPDNMSTLCADGYIPTTNADGTYTVMQDAPTTYAVAVADTEHGAVTVRPRYAERGRTVTVTVTPDDGYVLETLTVTDKNGNAVELTDKGSGKYTFKMPGRRVEIKATFMEDNSVLNFFVDVPNDAYYYEAVKWAVENGITQGRTETTFCPEDTCTRAEIVTFLWRAFGSPEVTSAVSYTDVDTDAYYAAAVAWAVENGITVGTSDTTFSPDDTCTRAQAVTFLCRAAGLPEAASALRFTDVAESDYFAGPVKWAVENGVTVGTSDTTFSPDDTCTRAQIVTFLFRLYVEK